MKNGRDILERAQAEANVAMLKKYFTLLFKKKNTCCTKQKKKIIDQTKYWNKNNLHLHNKSKKSHLIKKESLEETQAKKCPNLIMM